MLRFTLILVVFAVVTANFASAGPAPKLSDEIPCEGQCNIPGKPGLFSMGKCLPHYCQCWVHGFAERGTYRLKKCPEGQVYYKEAEHYWQHMCIDWYLDPECQ